MDRKRRREDPEVRRSQILAAARRSFRLHGLQVTTVDKIAAEAQVSVGLLYRFFKSKAEMVKAIIVEDVEQQLEQIALALQDYAAGSGDLSELMTARLAETTVDRERLALMLEIAAEICRNPALSDFMRRKREELRNDLGARLESQGLDSKQADLLIQQIDRVSAVATGFAVHALIYSESIGSIPAELAAIINAAPPSEFQSGRGGPDAK